MDDKIIRPDLFHELYQKVIKTEYLKTAAHVETVPTLIESIYNTAKLLFNKTAKDFASTEEAERWAEANGIKIKIRHKAGSFVGDNLKQYEGRDDSKKPRP